MSVVKRLQRLFTQNLLLKIVSLIIAFLLWGFLMLEKKSEIALSIPIRVENIPAATVITEPPPGDLRVVVRGRRTQLGSISDRVLPYVVDLRGAKSGVSTFDVIAAKINLPRGLQIVNISPAQFDVRLAPVQERKLPVMPRFRGTLPPGYKLVSYRVEPEIIDIAAARDEVKDLAIIETEPIDLSVVRGDLQVTADLALNDLHILDLTTHAVEVTLSIEQQLEERAIAGIAVTPPPGRRFAGRKSVNVVVTGPAELVRALKPASFEATVDTPPAGQRSRLAVRIDAPERVNVIRISPATLEVLP